MYFVTGTKRKINNKIVAVQESSFGPTPLTLILIASLNVAVTLHKVCFVTNCIKQCWVIVEQITCHQLYSWLLAVFRLETMPPTLRTQWLLVWNCGAWNMFFLPVPTNGHVRCRCISLFDNSSWQDLSSIDIW